MAKGHKYPICDLLNMVTMLQSQGSVDVAKGHECPICELLNMVTMLRSQGSVVVAKCHKYPICDLLNMVNNTPVTRKCGFGKGHK